MKKKHYLHMASNSGCMEALTSEKGLSWLFAGNSCTWHSYDVT